jgi:hypothetical protein
MRSLGISLAHERRYNTAFSFALRIRFSPSKLLFCVLFIKRTVIVPFGRLDVIGGMPVPEISEGVGRLGVSYAFKSNTPPPLISITVRLSLMSGTGGIVCLRPLQIV